MPSFAERNPRIRYFRNKTGHNSQFPTEVFELPSAPVQVAAHDDLYHPRYLQTCVRILDDDPNVILAHSSTAFVDDHGQPFLSTPRTEYYIDPRTGIAQTADSPMVADSPVAIVRFWQVLSAH